MLLKNEATRGRPRLFYDHSNLILRVVVIKRGVRSTVIHMTCPSQYQCIRIMLSSLHLTAIEKRKAAMNNQLMQLPSPRRRTVHLRQAFPYLRFLLYVFSQF